MREKGAGVIVNMTSGAGDLVPVPIHRGPDPGSASGPGSTRSESASVASSSVGIGEPRRFTRPARPPSTGSAMSSLPEFRDLGIAVVMVDPGFTRTELVELMGERGVVDPGAAVPMEVPMKTVIHVITSDNPLQYTGQILRAAAFVTENAL